MKPLQKQRIAQALESRKPNSALLWLEESQDTERELRNVWAERIEAPATDVLLALVNLNDSSEAIHEFRRLVPLQYDIARAGDQELIGLRDELREFWQEVSNERSHVGPTGVTGDNVKVALALHGWWKRYDLDSDGWKIFWETGTIFPTQKNFRGVVARILFDKRRYLALCNGCNQYFIKRRDDQKYCHAASCQRKANNLRQKSFQRNKQAARKSRKRA